MASSPAPTTPDNGPRRSVMNRSVTAPIRTSPSIAGPRPPPEIGATEGVETLYTHPNASIVKFTTLSSRPSSSSPGRQHGGPALLPWTSATERTVAAGPLQVYRVPGSVSFLNSGTLLHAILPRSQCWCVDGVSKFALRVLPDTYYRIELPGKTEDDKEEVERLKLTLQKVCFYERTPCPFERGFDVEIQDEADLTVRKKRRKSHGPAKKWKLDRQHSWKPEGWQPEEGRGSADEGSGSGVGSDVGSEDESMSTSGREDSGIEEKGEESAQQVRQQPKPTTPSRVQGARKLFEQRSVTAPAAQLTLQSPPPTRLRTRVDVDGTVDVAEPAAEGASEKETPRQRTFQAIPTDMPPSPPDSSAGLEQAELREQSSRERLDAQVSVGAERLASRDEFDNGEATEEAAEGYDTVIIHNVEAASESAAQESKADNPLEDLRQDVPLAASELPDKGQADSTQSRNTDISVDPESAENASLPSSEPPDREERVTQSMNTDIPVEPEQRPITPPPPPMVSDRRQSDPFTASSPPTAPANFPSPTPSESPSKPRSNSSNHPEDPFAAIQARILARRTIGGTTSFHPPQPLPTASSNSSGSGSSTLSRRSHSHSSQQQQQAFATAMVRKACSVFLGPPAHLVAIMLRIAARFAKGAFGVDGVFHVESPVDVRGRVPGSYQVFANGEVEGLDGLRLEREEELEEWEEDDFGVPLRSPVRLASMSSLKRSESLTSEGVRERSGMGWEVD